MKILVVGGEGTLGKVLCGQLKKRHQVVTAGRKSGDIHLDITLEDSVRAAFTAVSEIDAVVSVASSGPLDDFSQLTTEKLISDTRAKLFGQIGLILIGQKFLRSNGSFTLTSGIFADIPYKGVTGGGLISGALHSFILSAAMELPRGLRANVVSPSMLTESAEQYGKYFPGLRPVPAESVVDHFISAIETSITGQILRCYWPK